MLTNTRFAIAAALLLGAAAFFSRSESSASRAFYWFAIALNAALALPFSVTWLIAPRRDWCGNHRRHCALVRLSGGGRSLQFGRTSAPIKPH